MADCLHQVGFAQANAAAEKQGVELPARGFGHRQGGGMGHAAVRAHHEAVEHVAGVKAGSQLARRFAGGGGAVGGAIGPVGLARTAPLAAARFTRGAGPRGGHRG